MRAYLNTNFDFFSTTASDWLDIGENCSENVSVSTDE